MIGSGNTGAVTDPGNGTAVKAIDKKKTIEWFEKAAEKNFAHGIMLLAYCYKEGDGVEKNVEKATECKNTILSKPLYTNQNAELDTFYSIPDFEKSTVNFVNDIQLKVINEYKSLYGND